MRARTDLVSSLSLSFHVGSGCQTPDAYRNALELSHKVFEYAVSLRFVYIRYILMLCLK